MSEFLNFEEAFRCPFSGCRGTCECGAEFYNPDNCWDWEEGELERLEADKDTIGINHSVGYVKFEGREYVDACDCWHKRAQSIIEFIVGHGSGIADFLNAERKRKIAEANLVTPVVS